MKSNFRIEVSGTDEEGNWTATGFDQVLYMIATNPGEPLRQMEHIASGGELSRVMLALKASVEAASGKKRSSGAQRTLVFDEIDTGIGGRAAEAVGKKLKSLSRIEPGPLRHPPPANRHLRRPSLPDRKESHRRPDPDQRPSHQRGRAYRRSGPNAQRRQTDRNLAQACRADAQDQRVRTLAPEKYSLGPMTKLRHNSCRISTEVTLVAGQ